MTKSYVDNYILKLKQGLDSIDRKNIDAVIKVIFNE